MWRWILNRDIERGSGEFFVRRNITLTLSFDISDTKKVRS